MARIDVARKRKTAWPWVLGLAALVLAGWGITVLLTADDDEDAGVPVPTVEDTLPPAPIPAAPEAVGATDPARDLAEIAPLGEEDVGQQVRLAGEVVATGSRGFWLLAGEDVLRIESPRLVRRGDSVAVRGTLRRGDPERAERIASEVLSRRAGGADWSVVGSVRVVEERPEVDLADGREV